MTSDLNLCFSVVNGFVNVTIKSVDFTKSVT